MGLSASDKVGKTARWRRLRLLILKRDGYKCVQCGVSGRLEVDHIQSVSTAPELAYDPNNLQALCRSCHSYKTLVERGHKPATPARKHWQRFVRSPVPLIN